MQSTPGGLPACGWAMCDGSVQSTPGGLPACGWAMCDGSVQSTPGGLPACGWTMCDGSVDTRANEHEVVLLKLASTQQLFSVKIIWFHSIVYCHMRWSLTGPFHGFHFKVHSMPYVQVHSPISIQYLSFSIKYSVFHSQQFLDYGKPDW